MATWLTRGSSSPCDSIRLCKATLFIRPRLAPLSRFLHPLARSQRVAHHRGLTCTPRTSTVVCRLATMWCRTRLVKSPSCSKTIHCMRRRHHRAPCHATLPPPGAAPLVDWYGYQPPPGAVAVMPGDPRIGGTLCYKCGGTGNANDLFSLFGLDDECNTCGGAGRIMR